eukprot:CAMPEP_0179313340 /NCGR_PEP_ID=MMETSP0797-20121207/53774_1 /TAXON_ID=47934 /ORGANISM="Dinophysis acuminata, Strain DAEP01" /LENGTH=310 /DNA_ID=CAMNT_0021023387 /DNA_START=231 /DNA_END=1163 /DNA_ORIENTATION=+
MIYPAVLFLLLVGLAAEQSDVAGLAPSGPPGIPDLPVVCPVLDPVADQEYGVVDNRVSLAAVEDAAAIDIQARAPTEMATGPARSASISGWILFDGKVFHPVRPSTRLPFLLCPFSWTLHDLVCILYGFAWLACRPWSSMYFMASSTVAPPPVPPQSWGFGTQSTSSWMENVRWDFMWMWWRASSMPVVATAQQEPQSPWSATCFVMFAQSRLSARSPDISTAGSRARNDAVAVLAEALRAPYMAPAAEPRKLLFRVITKVVDDSGPEPPLLVVLPLDLLESLVEEGPSFFVLWRAGLVLALILDHELLK